MNIRIRYFASLREVVGRNEETIIVPEGASVATVREQLLTRYPRLQTIMVRAINAVNHRYVSAETTLHENDELVFVPPMGGGGPSWNQ